MSVTSKNVALLFLAFVSLSGFYANGQAPAQTAKDYIRPYTGSFQYGVNMGYYNANWPDESLAKAAQDLGVHTIRPALPESFMEQYGYNIRASTFNAYVATLGMKEITCFVESPSPAHRDLTTYPNCAGPSKLFANLYKPIWNADGSVNADNYYASYLHKLLLVYGDKVRIWEVVNEPDFTNSSAVKDWLTRAPQPSELPNLQAPIYHYIRMLRISYEVIKKYRPEAYVTVGGVGYAPFVDALLRYTDNPNGGTATAQYPHTAGAYLELLSFHSYPAFALHYWDTSINNFGYNRTSDHAAYQVMKDRQDMADVLAKYGYGSTYPAKPLMITETNVSRRTAGSRTGTDEMQRNFGIKTLVLAQKNDIKQLYFYSMGESTDAPAPNQPVSDEFRLMGLYENLTRAAPGTQRTTQLGQAVATTSKLLYGFAYDAARTAALALPATVEGAAFRKNGSYVYVLWAKALTDNSEYASATYSFPLAWNLGPLQRYEWNHAATAIQTVQATQNIFLGGTPAFFSQGTSGIIAATSITPSSAPVGARVTVTGTNLTGATSVSFNGTTTTTFVSSSATQVVLNVPSGATSGLVTVTTPAGTSSGVAFSVVTATGTTASQAGSDLSVYPDPVPDGQLTVELTGYRKAVQLTVVNSLGQVVYASIIPAGQTSPVLDLYGLPAGVYSLRAQTDTGVATRRFVRQ